MRISSNSRWSPCSLRCSSTANHPMTLITPPGCAQTRRPLRPAWSFELALDDSGRFPAFLGRWRAVWTVCRGRRASGVQARAAMLESFGRLGTLPSSDTDHRPGAPGAGQRRDPARAARDAADRARSRTRRATRRRAACARSPAYSGPACRSAVDAERIGGYDTLREQAGARSAEPAEDDRRDRRLPGRPRGPRPRRPGLVHLWASSAAPRERLGGHRPRRRRRRLPHRQARGGHDDRRSPWPGPRSTRAAPPRDLGLPRALLGRSSRTGWAGPARPTSSPARRAAALRGGRP